VIRELREFLASLTAVNTEIGLYIFGRMDVNNGLSPSPFDPDREEALGAQMVRLGESLQQLAVDRRRTVEGTATVDGVLPDEPSAHKPQIPEF
jgi:hypothetical protein